MDQKILNDEAEEKYVWMLIDTVMHEYLAEMKHETMALIKSMLIERQEIKASIEKFKGTDIFEKELQNFIEIQAELFMKKSVELKEFRQQQFNRLSARIKEEQHKQMS